MYGDGRYGLALTMAKWSLKQMAKSIASEKQSLDDQDNQSPLTFTPNILALMPPEYASEMEHEEVNNKPDSTVRVVQRLDLGPILNFCRLIFPSSGLMIITKIFEGDIKTLSDKMTERETVII